MPTRSDCRREIERLHDAFVGLYTGRADSVAPVEDALAPAFEMVSPEGDTLGRESVLTMVREKTGSYAPDEFAIEIRNVRLIAAADDVAVCRYEEWQTTPESETGRVSTAVFRIESSAPDGLSWLSVHETWC